MPDLPDVRHHRRVPAQHRAHRQQALQIISAAQASGQARLAEMNQQVASNLAKIITALEDDHAGAAPEEAADAS